MASEFGIESGSEDVGFSVAGNAGGAVEVGKEGPDWLGSKRDAEVAGFDTVASVEVEIACLANGFKDVDSPPIQRSVEVVGVEDADDLVGHRFEVLR